MRTRLISILSIVFLFLSCAPPAVPASPQTKEAVRAINEMLIEEYSDDYYAERGIKASLKSNSIVIYSTVPPDEVYKAGRSSEGLDEHYSTLYAQVYRRLVERGIDCSQIAYFILYHDPAMRNKEFKSKGAVKGTIMDEWIDNGVPPEQVWDLAKEYEMDEIANKILIYVRIERQYNKNWGKSDRTLHWYLDPNN